MHLILICIDHPVAANQIFLMSDDEDLSITESDGSWIIESRDNTSKQEQYYTCLTGSLQVDITKTVEILGWMLPVEVDESVKKTAESFLARKILY